MSKLDNLTDFLTDVANAIREKKGTADKINPQDFSEEISSIKTEIESLPVNDVTFYDYDGIVLYSYTKEEFLALTEMPPLPTRKGLICQEWNWDYQDAIDYVAEYGILDVGATYITDDGKTRLYIRIASNVNLDTSLCFYQSVDRGVNIDWGDGSPIETVSGTKFINTSHRYNSIGDYVISLDCLAGKMRLGNNTESYCVMGETSSDNLKNSSKLYRVEFGANTELYSSFTFENCRSLISVTLHNKIPEMSPATFSNCRSLKHIAFPRKITGYCSQVLGTCTSLVSVSINKTCNTAEYMVYNNHAIQRLIIPPMVKKIERYYISNSNSLTFLIIPKSVNTINAYAFSGALCMKYYDFSHLEAIPTLENVNAFSGIPDDCKIIVPDALYDEWIAATNWSTYASYIIRKTDWDSQK